MNKELFYQLAHQASFWCDQNIPQQFSEEIMGYGEAWEEKFAELIVQETLMQMAIQMNKFGDDQSNNPAWYKSEEAVKKHFGVEE